MTIGEIILIVLKVAIGVLPFLVTFYVLFHFVEPMVLRKSGGVVGAIAWVGLFVICLLLSLIIALEVSGMLRLRDLLSYLVVSIPEAIFFLALVLFSIIIAKSHDQSGDEASRDKAEAQSSGLVNTVLLARRERSDYRIGQYNRIKNRDPYEKNYLKKAALLAVKSDKKNPEAQFILGESYLALDNLNKAQKHAAIALQLDPKNERYKGLCVKIEERSNLHT